MKKLFKTGLVLVAFAGLGTFVVPTVRTADASTSDSAKRSGTSSRPLYLNNCARCHGADGRGDTELGRLNDTPDISNGRARRVGATGLTRLVTRGRGSMPGFSKKLNKKQISAVVAYVRTL